MIRFLAGMATMSAIVAWVSPDIRLEVQIISTVGWIALMAVMIHEERGKGG